MRWKTIHCQKEVAPAADKALYFLARFTMVLFTALLIGSALVLFVGCENPASGTKTETETETVYINPEDQTPEESGAYIGTWAMIGNKVALRKDDTFSFYDPLTDAEEDKGSYTVIVNILTLTSSETGNTAKYIIEVKGDVMTWTPDGGYSFDWERAE